MLHKHHLIIRVGAGLIQFVYGSHSRLTADLTLDKNLFSLPFLRGFSWFPGREHLPHVVLGHCRLRASVLTHLHITRDIGVQTGLHSHDAQSEWFIWQYSHSDGCILPDLSQWARNSMLLHHFRSELIPNACSF